MKQTLRNLPAAVAAALLLLCAPSAGALSRSYSVDDLTSGQWLPSESMYQYVAYTSRSTPIFRSDILLEVNTAGLSLEKTSANTITVKGAFGGLMDLPFTYNGSTFVLNTNATAGGDPVYLVNNPANHPDIREIILSPTRVVSGNYNYTYGQVINYVHQYTSGGWTSLAIDEVEDTQDENGLYDLCLSFNDRPVELQITYTNGNTVKIYVDTWQLDFFKPTVSISDVEEKNSASTARSYRGEFDFLPDSKFQLAGLGGRYAGVAPEWGYAYGTSIFASNVNYFTGSYDLSAGTAVLGSAKYTADLDTPNPLSLLYDPELHVYWTAERKADGSYKKDIDGTVRVIPDAAAHRGATRWVTNGGDCTTWTRLEFKFNDFVALDEDDYTADANVGVIKDTRIVPDKDVEVTLGVDILAGRLELGLEKETDPFLTAKVPFVITENEHFSTSYDVYVLQGNVSHYANVDMSKAQLVGSVAYNAANRGEYMVKGTFVPDINVKPGEKFEDDFTFFVRANYGREQAAGTQRRAAAPLEPTHHDLTTAHFSTTVGVDGVGAESVRVEKTLNGVMVCAPADMPVEVYNAEGVKVAQGRANEEIAISAGGVFIVKVADKAFKLMR